MKLHILTFGCFLLLACACSNNQTTPEEKVATAVITVDELLSNSDKYTQQDVVIKGTVTHVCRHGGQRLFVIGSDADQRLKITTSAAISEFSIDLEGREIEISGILNEERIDENYLQTWEREVLSKNEKAHEEGMGVHDGNHTHSCQEELEKINNYREQIKTSGKGYLSFYSVVCDSYKEL